MRFHVNLPKPPSLALVMGALGGIALAYSAALRLAMGMVAAWSPESRVLVFVCVLMISVYLGVWVLSLRFRPFSTVLAALTCVSSWRASLAWGAVGLCVPLLAVGLSWAWGDYEWRDWDLFPSLLGNHRSHWLGTLAWALYEEVIDRGLILLLLVASLARVKHGAALALLIGAAGFAMGHSSLDGFRFARFAAFGVLSGLLCLRYQSIFPGLALHAASNASLNTLHGNQWAGGLLLSHSGPHLTVDMSLYGLMVVGLLRSGIKAR